MSSFTSSSALFLFEHFVDVPLQIPIYLFIHYYLLYLLLFILTSPHGESKKKKHSREKMLSHTIHIKTSHNKVIIQQLFFACIFFENYFGVLHNIQQNGFSFEAETFLLKFTQ